MSKNDPSIWSAADYKRRVQAETHWLQVALQRQLWDEAGEVVLDWLEYWNECQHAKYSDGLMAINRAVMPLGDDMRSLLEIFAHCAQDETEREALTAWLNALPHSGTSAPKPTSLDETALCDAYRERRRSHEIIQYRRRSEDALRWLIGEVLNHSMVGGLLPVTENFSLLARELFFRRLQRKQLLLSADSDAEQPLRRRIEAEFSLEADNDVKTSAFEPRWLRKMVYSFYRLVQLWLIRPLMRDDFLFVCHAEGIDISAEELAWLTRARILKPLIPNGKPHVYHVVQVFALSSLWAEYHAQRYTASQLFAEKVAQAIDSVWERLAWLTPDDRLNGNGWLSLTQQARERRAEAVQAPARRLWVEGLANLASAYLFAIGVRPFASKGRPRLAPDDPVMRALEEMVQRYYQAQHTFKGCMPFIRKGTLDEVDRSVALAFFRAQAPIFTVQLPDEEPFYRAWQQKFGGEWMFERAFEEVRSMIETLPDEAQDRGALFAFERMASQPYVPLARETTNVGQLSADVLAFADPLLDGPARSVGCWDTRSWTWWIVPRWCFRQRWGQTWMRDWSWLFMRIDATRTFTLASYIDVPS